MGKRSGVAAMVGGLLVAGCQTESGSTVSLGRPISPPVSTISYAASDLRPLTPAEKKLLGDSFAKGLKDPDSARFQWMPFPKNAGQSDNNVVTYCGMVNAKNSYGGYIGAAPFMATVFLKDGKPVGGVLTTTGPGDLAHYVRTECQKHGWDPYLAT